MTQGNFTWQLIAFAVPAVRRHPKSLQLGVAVGVVTGVFTVIVVEQVFALFSKNPEVIVIGVQMGRLADSFYFIHVFPEVYAAANRVA